MSKKTDKSEKIEDQVRNSEANKRAKSKAEEYAKDPDKLNELLDKASEKAASKKWPLAAVYTQLMACFRLLRAYANGSYRQIPWQSLIMVITSVTYFVMPFDLIPDFLVGIGYLDDAALLAWTLKSISADIDAFIEWENNQKA